MNRKHYWKKLASILNVKYNKPFYTDGWGTYKITSKGLYDYDNNCYDEINNNEYLYMLLNGDIEIIRDIDKWELDNNCKLTLYE